MSKSSLQLLLAFALVLTAASPIAIAVFKLPMYPTLIAVLLFDLNVLVPVVANAIAERT